MEKIKELYWLRFDAEERHLKDKLWKVLCNNFFQKYIDKEATVLDLGAGLCEFINNIQCKKKIAVDINEDTEKFAKKDVLIFITSGTDMKTISDNSVDIVFASEFFEHLKNVEELFATFLEIRRVLKREGKLLILCPNIRFLANRYWDFIDHRLAISDASMKEGLLLYNFKVIKIIPKFLPFTTKSRLPKSQILLKIYLSLPMLWKIFGRQMFIVAQK